MKPNRLDSVSEDAIAWLVELRSGHANADTQRAFDTWLSADPRHKNAWHRLEQALAQTFSGVEALPTEQQSHAQRVEHVLLKSSLRIRHRRRLIRGALGIASLGFGATWIARQTGLLPDVAADLYTGTSERRQWTLADGTSVLLDARSAADVVFSAHQRKVHLREGQLIANTQADRLRPFIIACAYGQARAPSEGARILVKQEATRSLIVALQKSVHVNSNHRQSEQAWLAPGQSAWLDKDGITPADPAVASLAADWQHGMLSAVNVPLADIVQAMRAYRHGVIRVSTDAAGLRVSGRYSLDDTDATLQALAETLPITTRSYSAGWLVVIERRQV